MSLGFAMSKIAGTLAVIVITLLLGYFLFVYGQSTMNNQYASVSVQASIFVNPSTGQTYLSYSLQNNGNIEVVIKNIQTGNETINVDIALPPGQTYQNTTAFPIIAQPGSYYTIIFQGVTATGEPFSVTENVLASD